ncbi:dermonecrotic toxin domain-containing protein [Pseudomonas sp. PD9R]|uniref:dermonecrotic toxin domain-containing protein n=1 Tax=Pseudomonas sp. PD9R TaxID=2853534 RepID=UPI001C4500DF|nr:DUF6543 domain-containing protein [Pseudomonas sp. PD9R]MBV6826056.1 leucine-rich repeat domain-containing protein [Pseudomonas sp. PD9R]
MSEVCEKQCSDNPHKNFIEEKIPAWLTQASPLRREALRRTPVVIPDWYRTASEAAHSTLAQAIKASWLSQTKVDRIFKRLGDARRFSEPLLRQALKERFGIELDVNRTWLRLYMPTGTVVGYQVRTLSLLDAALHNFENKEAAVNYFDPASCLISEPDNVGHFRVLAVNSRISISAFVSLCRELDIGGQYSQQLEALLLPGDAVAKAVLALRVKTCQKDAFKAALLLARMKGDIGPGSHTLLMQRLDGVTGPILQCYQLQIMDAPLTGIMLLGADLERASTVQPLVVYIPDDPQHPIKEYPSTRAFMAKLTEQLRSTTYQSFFARFIAHEQRGHFFAALDNHLNVVTWHPHPPGDPQPSWLRTPVENPRLRFGMRSIQGDPWQWLYQDKLNKVLNDARVIAVPTADEDRQSRWALWDSVEKVGSIVLQVVTLVALPFIPFLGELMLAYTAWQLLDETFTGVLDWAEGQVVEATDHLLAIAENLAQLGAIGIGGAVAGRLLAIKPSAFVEGLKPVVLGDGRSRLWNPDIQPYEQDSSLTVGSVTDELGLHQQDGKTLLTLEGRTYEVAIEPGSNGYQVLHPQRSSAYRPRLTHNGAGAWANEVERPMEWQGAQLFRRLGYSVAEFSDETARRILAVSGVDEAALRHMHVHAQRPPALLDDTIRRFKSDQQIQAFITQLQSPDPAVYSRADPHMQVQLLNARGISVPQDWSNSGDVVRSIVKTTDDQTLKKILGESPSFGDPLPGTTVRIARLRARMAIWAQEHRVDLFQVREAAFEQSDEALTLQLRRVFPELPKTIALELSRNAGAAEHLRIQGKLGITQHLAQEALFYLREVRLSRACEGIYLDSVISPDSDRLALHMLDTLNGWSSDVRIEVREVDFDGVLLDSIGRPEAAIRKILVRQHGQYWAYDSSGEQLSGLQTLYGAVMHALPDRQRLGLGLPHITQGIGLKHAVRLQPLPTRPVLRALFGQPPLEPGTRSPMGLAVGRAGYLLGGGDIKPVQLQSVEQRLRTLYPTLSEEQRATLSNERFSGDPLLAVSRLENEYLTLVNDLDAWCVDVPSHHPATNSLLTDEYLAAQRQRRRLFAQELQANWSRRLTTANAFTTTTLEFNLDILGVLPELSADFSHVLELSLSSGSPHLGGHAFFARFPGVRYLTLSGFALETFPVEIYQMRELVTLTLEDCGIRLSEAAVEGLAHLENLTLLDLSNNPLERTPDVGYMKKLDSLYLKDAGLTAAPSGLFTLESLAFADMTFNQISLLPDELFEVSDARDVNYNFRNNPLSEVSRLRVAGYIDNSGSDSKILIQIDEEPDIDFESDEGDEVFSDESGIGSGED